MTYDIQAKAQHISDEEVSKRIAKNLRYYMYLSGETNATELSRKTGIPQPTIQRLMTARTPNPGIATLKEIANHFNVSLDDLLMESPQQKNYLSTEATKIPIVPWEYLEEYFSGNKQHIKQSITLDTETRKHCLAIFSQPAMEPHFLKGTLLIFDPNINAQDGNFVLVQFIQNGFALKSLTIDGPVKILNPLVEASEASKIDENTVIKGVLIESRYRYLNEL